MQATIPGIDQPMGFRQSLLLFLFQQ